MDNYQLASLVIATLSILFLFFKKTSSIGYFAIGIYFLLQAFREWGKGNTFSAISLGVIFLAVLALTGYHYNKIRGGESK